MPNNKFIAENTEDKFLYKNSDSKAALYVRVSTEEQARDGVSISAQVETLTQYCRLYNISIFKIYKDLGVSGKSLKNRAGLREMLFDADAGLFNMIIVWKISRLTRSLKDLLMLIDIFEKANIDFMSYSEKLDTSTPVGRMTLQLLGSIAEFERNTIVENVKLGLKEFARNGGKSASVIGYDNINKKLVINQKEAEIVKKIFHLFVNEGFGLSKIASFLNTNGYKTKRNCHFRSDSIGVILDNPVYIGLNRHKQNQSDSYTIKGNHTPIIDEELWDKAKALRNSRIPFSKLNSKKNYALLTGFIFCPLCGKELHVFYTTANKKTYKYYKCSSKNNNEHTCTGFSINSIVLEKQILEILKRIILNDALGEDLIKFSKKTKADLFIYEEKKLSVIEKQISKQNELLKKYFNLFENGKLNNDELLLERISIIEEHLSLLNNEKESFEALDSNEIAISNYVVREFVNSLEHCDKEDLRRLLSVLIEKIELDASKNLKSIAFTIPINGHKKVFFSI